MRVAKRTGRSFLGFGSTITLAGMDFCAAFVIMMMVFTTRDWRGCVANRVKSSRCHWRTKDSCCEQQNQDP